MPQYLKEDSALGSFNDLIALATRYRMKLSDKKSPNYLNKSSIAKASKDLIMSFPVLCSDTVDYPTALMICKAIERNSITMLQMLLTSANLTGSNGVDVIKQWHNNIDSNMSMDDYLNIYDVAKDDYDNYSESSTWSAPGYAEFQQQYKTAYLGSLNVKFPLNNLSEHSINEYAANNRSGRLDIFVLSEARKKDPEKNPNVSDREKFNLDIDKFNYQKDYGEYNDSIKNKLSKDRNDSENLKNVSDYFTKQLLDSDVKKANELVPSLIIIRFRPIASDHLKDVDKGDTAVFPVQEFIAGVKARLISVPSEEIIARIVAQDRDKIDMKNLIRATTKEISFTKDFVGGIKQAKLDAINNSKLSATNPIWRALQNRAAKSNINRLMRKTANNAAAITTVVLSQAEVNYVKNTYNIDLDNPGVAADFMQSYNLIAIVIADEQAEIAKFLYDGDKYYQTLTFSSLERETGDGSYKKIINLVSKINRG